MNITDIRHFTSLQSFFYYVNKESTLVPGFYRFTYDYWFQVIRSVLSHYSTFNRIQKANSKFTQMNNLTKDKNDNEDLAIETFDSIRTKRSLWFNAKPQNLTADQVKSLVEEQISNPTISILSLRNTNLNTASAYQLAELLKVNTKIKWLHLSYNEITDVGVQAICRVMKTKNRTLTFLDLAKNRITDKSVDQIIEMILRNRQLIALILKDNYLSIEGQQRIVDVATSRKPRLRIYL
ncbi:hypothetical protein I4U23_022838 [Adineta vaga]|nr:hypothetical protein I4U23_022838 [Adineta vaga]